MAAQKSKSKKAKRSVCHGWMTAADVMFAELNAMTREEQEDIALRFLDWIQDNELAS